MPFSGIWADDSDEEVEAKPSRTKADFQFGISFISGGLKDGSKKETNSKQNEQSDQDDESGDEIVIGKNVHKPTKNKDISGASSFSKKQSFAGMRDSGKIDSSHVLFCKY